jgi:hypothetical protein
MGAVAERLICGVPTAAKPYGGPAGQSKRSALRIENLKFAFDADGTVVVDSDLRGRHFFSRTAVSMPKLPGSYKHKPTLPRRLGRGVGLG